MSRLTDGSVFVCMNAMGAFESSIPTVKVERFEGKHPAGLAGTHIHYLDPVSANKTVWQVNYQDVIAIGHLFLSGQIYTPGWCPSQVRRSVIPRCSGRSWSRFSRPHRRASRSRSAPVRSVAASSMGSQRPVQRRIWADFALKSQCLRKALVASSSSSSCLVRQVLSNGIVCLLGARKEAFDLTTSTGGSDHSIIPLGTFERLTPLDILPTQLLRSLVVEDIEASIDLGCLELDEEDVALYTFACPGKYEYGPILRALLHKIEVEG